MNPLSFAFVAGIAILGAAAVVGGCADTCADLQLLCNRCVDPNHKSSCEVVVDTGSSDACDQGLDDYTNVCK